MTTKTNAVRLEIKSRLASLSAEKGKAANIQAVLNPVEGKDPKNRPVTGRTALLWTEPGKALSSQGNAVRWHQEWAIDLFVEWEEEAESLLDQIKVEMAAALLPRITGVQEQKLGALAISYPANGSGGALVSVEIVTVYVETLS
jgi:hypothetical protein